MIEDREGTIRCELDADDVIQVSILAHGHNLIVQMALTEEQRDRFVYALMNPIRREKGD